MLLLEDKIVGGQVKNSYTLKIIQDLKRYLDRACRLMQQQAEELGANIEEFDIIENLNLMEMKK